MCAEKTHPIKNFRSKKINNPISLLTTERLESSTILGHNDWIALGNGELVNLRYVKRITCNAKECTMTAEDVHPASSQLLGDYLHERSYKFDRSAPACTDICRLVEKLSSIKLE